MPHRRLNARKIAPMRRPKRIASSREYSQPVAADRVRVRFSRYVRVVKMHAPERVLEVAAAVEARHLPRDLLGIERD